MFLSFRSCSASVSEFSASFSEFSEFFKVFRGFFGVSEFFVVFRTFYVNSLIVDTISKTTVCSSILTFQLSMHRISICDSDSHIVSVSRCIWAGRFNI